MECTPKGFLKIGNGLSWIVNLGREGLQLHTTRLLHDVILLVEVWCCLVPGASTIMVEYDIQFVACLLKSTFKLVFALKKNRITARTNQQQPCTFKAHCRFTWGALQKAFSRLEMSLSWILNLGREDLQLQTTRLVHDILLLVEVWWCLVPGASTIMPEYALICVACLLSLPLNLCLNWRKIYHGKKETTTTMNITAHCRLTWGARQKAFSRLELA